MPLFWHRETVMIDKKLLSILVCPVSKAPVEYDKDKDELVCKASGLAYPVRDGIPADMLADVSIRKTKRLPESVLPRQLGRRHAKTSSSNNSSCRSNSRFCLKRCQRLLTCRSSIVRDQR